MSQEQLTQALQGLLDKYTMLVNSGDAGNWDPEEEPEVIAARAALSATQPAQAAQGAGEVVGWLVSLENEPELGEWFAEEDISAYGYISKPLYTTPPQQPAPVVPDDFVRVPKPVFDKAVSALEKYSQAPTDYHLSVLRMRDALRELAATHTPPAQAAADARDAQPMIPLSMLRPIAVEAIRSITGCPDLSSGDRHLTDEIEAVAIAALATHQQGGSDGV